MTTEVFEVLEPGRSSTIQDLGRSGHQSQGVPPGGALDLFAFTAANLLVGNATSAAALECRQGGLRLKALRASVIAVTGGEPEVWINGSRAPSWTAFLVGPDDEVRVPRLASGSLFYLAVSGGLEASEWLGSRSTYLPAGLAGLAGRRLTAGDRLSRTVLAPSQVAGRRLDRTLRPRYASPARLRALSGPHLRRLDFKAQRALFEREWTLSQESDRTGYRFFGQALPHSLSVASLGACVGSVQLPPEGQPVLLLAEHPTIGGYPLVACVIAADLPLAVQMSAGQTMRLDPVSLAEADRARREAAGALASIPL